MPKLLVTHGKVALKTAVVFAGLLSMSVASADALKVCSDPDNLPFSKAEGPDKGLYIELAEMVGKRLGSSVEYVWWLTHNQRRAIRNTMDGCDAYFALPATADYKVRGTDRSRAFMDVGFALIGPASFKFGSLEDLKGKRIGVLHGSPPHIMLSTESGYEPRNFKFQEEVFDALGKGEIDLAILWGPSAGYENQNRLQNRWALTPVAGFGLNGQVAVAVSKGKPELKEKNRSGADRAAARDQEAPEEIRLSADRTRGARCEGLVEQHHRAGSRRHCAGGHQEIQRQGFGEDLASRRQQDGSPGKHDQGG